MATQQLLSTYTNKNALTFEQRFWSKVQIATEVECWLWQGAVTTSGYGCIKHAKGKVYSAHRVAYALATGAIDAGMYILHSCDQKLCCNPAHLRQGTPSENVFEAWARERRLWNGPRQLFLVGSNGTNSAKRTSKTKM